MNSNKGVDTYAEVKAKQRIRSRNYYHNNRERCLALSKKWRENKNRVKKNRSNITEDEWRLIKRQRELKHYYKHRAEIIKRRKNKKKSTTYANDRLRINKPIPYWLPSATKCKVNITIRFD